MINSPINEAMVTKSSYLSFDGHVLTFQIQDGPVKEFGESGGQIDDLILFCRNFVVQANKLFPCRENSLTITKLEEAWMWLKSRKDDRLKRGIEGLDVV